MMNFYRQIVLTVFKVEVTELSEWDQNITLCVKWKELRALTDMFKKTHLSLLK